MKTIFLLIGVVLASTSISCQSTTPGGGASAAPAASADSMDVSAPKSQSQPKTKAAPGSVSTESSAPTVKPYPRDTCLVTDEPLDEWGEETRYIYQGQELKFCCKVCLGKFQKNPAKYLVNLN